MVDSPATRTADQLLRSALETSAEGSELEPIQRPDRGPKAAPSVRSQCEWDADQYRARTNLAHLIVRGAATTRDFARHPDLNLGDIALCPADIEELDAIVAKAVRSLAPLIQHAGEVSMREKIAAIDSGSVPAASATELDLRHAAEALVAHHAARAEPITIEAAMAIVSKNPQLHSWGPPGKRLFHHGRWYLVRDLGPLPETQAVFERVRMGGTEVFSVIASWFVHRGLTTPERLSDQWQAFQSASPP